MSPSVKCISFIYALYLFSVLNEYRFMFSVVNLVILCTFHSIYHLFCVYFSYVLFIKFICLI